MTKKKRNIIIAVVALGIISCVIPTKKEEVPSDTTAITAEADRSFLLDYELKTGDVKNGTGDTVIGEYAYIIIPTEKLDDITGEDIKEFADKNVAGSSYNWVSIMTESGEGITFSGSIASVATRGMLDESGALTETKGTWISGENGFTYKDN